MKLNIPEWTTRRVFMQYSEGKATVSNLSQIIMDPWKKRIEDISLSYLL